MRLHIGGFWASAMSFWHSYLDLASTPHPVPHLTTRSWLLQQDKPISICFKCFANQKPRKSCSCNSLRCHTRVSLALSPAPIGCVWICVDKFALAAPATLANFTTTGKSFRSQDGTKLLLFVFCIFAVCRRRQNYRLRRNACCVYSWTLRTSAATMPIPNRSQRGQVRASGAA